MKAILTTVLLSVFTFSAFAIDDPVIRIQEVVTQNELVKEIDNSNRYLSIVSAYDFDKHSVYLLIKHELFELNLNTLFWNSLGTLDLPPEIGKMSYSPRDKGLLFWDFGVGRVYLRDSTGVLSRIDNSFPHMNQFGHSPWINPESGDIFAFGGYGLFAFKSFITRFDREGGEWYLVPTRNPGSSPAPQIDGIILPDFVQSKIILIGDRESYRDVFPTNHSPIKQFAIWELNLNGLVWTKSQDLSSGYRTAGWSDYASNSMPTSVPGTGLFFFPMLTEFDQTSLFAYSSTHRDWVRLEDINPTVRSPHVIFYMFWSEFDKTLYHLSRQPLSNQNGHRFLIHRIHVESPEQLEAYIANKSTSTILKWSLWLFGLSLAAVLTWFGYGAFVRKRNALVSASPQRIEIQFDLNDHSFVVKHDGIVLRDLPQMESRLLGLLFKKSTEPGAFLSSDDIDSSLLPNHPSVDYIRRNRNVAIEKLEFAFQDLCPKPGEKYILRRTHKFDKRKTEYRLNDELISILA
jgi:hypothetical protein